MVLCSLLGYRLAESDPTCRSLRNVASRLPGNSAMSRVGSCGMVAALSAGECRPAMQVHHTVQNVEKCVGDCK